MDQGTVRRGKFVFVGLPFLLLIAYVIWIPSPAITKIEIKDNLGYIAEGYDFRIILPTPQREITSLSFEVFDSMVRSFTLDSNRAYIITSDGLVNIINIENPANPHKIAYFDTPGVPQAIAINGGFAYIAGGFEGIQIFSLREITQPIGIKTIDGLGFVSDIAQIENLTYAVRREQGVDIYDLGNYTEPKLIGHYDAGGPIGQFDIEKISHDGGRERLRGILLIGQRIVQIVDFTNPQQPNLLASYDFASIPIKKAFIQGNRIFVIQGNKSVLILGIKDSGELEQFASITGPRAIYDFAIMKDIAFLAGGIQGLQAYNFSDPTNVRALGNPYSNFWTFKTRIAILSFGFLLLWLGFFAQFVLPVQTNRDRQKIFGRLIIYLLGRHGPALFVEDGQVKEHSGERLKKGPGVVWLDTASAAVIRTATKFNETIGPGVHFTEKGEYLAGPLDLHIQIETLGPRENEKPFEEKAENQGEVEYEEIQKRRTMTSALTRDGIEIVPKITVLFRVNTKPPEDNQQPGSRFGYRTGTSHEEKEAEEEDKKAIYNAIAGEGIDPTFPEDLPRHRVAWNQLPGRLAVDVWREHVAKFTLDELFRQKTQEVPPPQLELPNPERGVAENQNPHEHAEPKPETLADVIAGILREINHLLSDAADLLEGRQKKNDDKAANNNVTSQPVQTTQKDETPEKKTALQIINEMVKKRLTQPVAERLNDTGERVTGDPERSKEYDLLQKRGLRVISVSISNLHFSKKVEEQLVSQWAANWYNNAKAERERIERHRNYIEMRSEEDAANEYVHTLSRYIMRVRPQNVQETLRALLMRSKFIIARDNQLPNRMSSERQDIEDILFWLENRQ